MTKSKNLRKATPNSPAGPMPAKRRKELREGINLVAELPPQSRPEIANGASAAEAAAYLTSLLSSTALRAALKKKLGLHDIFNEGRRFFAGHTAALYAVLAVMIGIGRTLRSDRVQWGIFCNLPVWKDFKGKKPEPDDVSRVWFLVVRCAVGVTGVDNRNCHRYAAALQDIFDGSMPVEQIASFIETSGGIEGLYEKRPSKAAPPSLPDLEPEETIIPVRSTYNLDEPAPPTLKRALEQFARDAQRSLLQMAINPERDDLSQPGRNARDFLVKFAQYHIELLEQGGPIYPPLQDIIDGWKGGATGSAPSCLM